MTVTEKMQTALDAIDVAATEFNTRFVCDTRILGVVEALKLYMRSLSSEQPLPIETSEAERQRLEAIQDEKRTVISGLDFSDDESIDNVMANLTLDQVKFLAQEIRCMLKEEVRFFCQNVMRKPTQRDKIATVEQRSKE